MNDQHTDPATMNEQPLKFSSPWEILSRKLEALFAQDPGVTVVSSLDAAEKKIKLLVQCEERAPLDRTGIALVYCLL